jgi:AhpD family alkylhydroperoxidase
MSCRIPYYQPSPEALKQLSATRPYIESTNIEPLLRALVELRSSQINGCAYCVDLHSREVREAGETEQRLDCLCVWRETTFFDERERAALAWAESVTLVSETHIPDDVYEEAHKHFSDKDLVDLTLIIAIINAWNRIAISFRANPPKRSAKSDN